LAQDPKPREKPGSRTFDVAILGAGFSGAMVATHLLRMSRDANADVRVRIVDPAPIGRGRAYATTSPAHRLNVRAAVMGAFPDDPEHFARWAHARNRSWNDDEYLPRGSYGDYIAEILNREAERSGAAFECVSDEAVDVEETSGGFRVRLRSGGTFSCGHLVLATGHPLPGLPVPIDPELLASGRYRENPWARHVLDDLAPDSSLLLLGSGLTTVDMLLETRRRGIAGTVHILSRRGLLPAPHAASLARRPAPPDIGGGNVRSMMRLLRDAIREARSQGEDWRTVFDALRPVTATLWAELPLQERRRFLRHVRPYWEVHRHRVAPDIATRVQEELRSRHAVLQAGRLIGLGREGDRVRATIQPRGRSERIQLTIDRVVNGTGPNTSIEMWRSDLTRALLSRGLCVRDELGIGLRSDPDGALVDARGRVSGRLFTLGPLRKGDLWESTAVPELRAQAVHVARRILSYT
jgi:uncharacterized NAD(P)/FAD-binding protein YdhS